MTVKERLSALRSLMQERGVDAYIVPTDDFHSSEYVGEFFKCREFITGFTGSAGTALIMQDAALMWTDGRYFLQGAAQLAGSGFNLMKMGQEGVPTLLSYLKTHMKSGQRLGFDGRTITATQGKTYRDAMTSLGADTDGHMDLIGEIWKNRPSMSCKPVWELKMQYAGKERSAKIDEIRKAMTDKKADYFLLTSLDDIAWLMNLRGGDVQCCPLFLAYVIVSASDVRLFAQKEAFSDEIRTLLANDGITLLPYEDIENAIASLDAAASILIDPNCVNDTLNSLIPASMTVIHSQNLTLLPKACKNAAEVENERMAHVLDGVAMTRFIYWLKHNVGKIDITEISAADKLEQLRGMAPSYLGPSFEPIIAYKEHGAIIHYSATPETNVPLQPLGMVLMDTGGNYNEGSTDITRTVVLGPLTDDEKAYFTRVLRGTMNLGGAKFLYGCTGQNLDYLARSPLWEIGEDYNHGTGHGVGYLLNIHEGPVGFRWKVVPERNDSAVLEEGMISSDEPGYYRENAFGIRHENMMVCVKDEKQPCGQFMRFDWLTLVPFDLEGVIPEMMTDRERQLLNEYHALVYEKISPYLDGEEKEWLKKVTAAVGSSALS